MSIAAYTRAYVVLQTLCIHTDIYMCRNKVEIMRVKVGLIYIYIKADCELPIHEYLWGYVYIMYNRDIQATFHRAVDANNSIKFKFK